MILSYYLVDATDRIVVYDMNVPANQIGEIELPGLGVVNEVAGKYNESDFYYSFSSFTNPGSFYKVDMNSFEQEHIYTSRINVSDLDFDDFITD